MSESDHGIGVNVTTEIGSIDLDRVHAWIANESYWAKNIPRATFDRAAANSLCFAALSGGETIGFARVMTDRATFAYLADVFVAREWRGRGVASRLMRAITVHPDLQGLRRWTLVTRDAHGLYAKFGFKPLAAPERFMERADPDIYERQAAKP
jgi:GNAT superfamily N-acetyltransferase